MLWSSDYETIFSIHMLQSWSERERDVMPWRVGRAEEREVHGQVPGERDIPWPLAFVNNGYRKPNN